MKIYKVPEDELRELLIAQNTLAALEDGGVDNWEWCGESWEDYRKWWLEEHAELVKNWPEEDRQYLGAEEMAEEDLKCYPYTEFGE